MRDDVEEWTWEASFYKYNKAFFEELLIKKDKIEKYKIEENADYFFHGIDYGKVLGYMLNHKVDVAYQMLMSEKYFEIPQYVKKAIKWISEEKND